MENISFIHAADLHLDSPFQGFAKVPEHIFQEMIESTFVALERLVQAAIEKQVDFVLLVGDLFDNEKQSLKAQVRLRRAFEQLAGHNIMVYLSYGNHDYMSGNIHPVSYPENVYIFPDEHVSAFTYEKGGKPLANIYGFSYEQRAVKDKKVSEYNILQPEIPFHIATLHGSIQTNTEHDVYAPFALQELAAKPFDYWALGHIHKRQILHSNPPIVYPGNIQGRNRKEVGEKGCYHVTLSETGADLAFIPLAPMEIVSVEVDVSPCKEIHEMEGAILTHIQQGDNPGPQLIDVQLRGPHSLLKQWEDSYKIEEMVDLINEILVDRKPWKFIFRITAKTEQSLEQAYKKPFLGEMIHYIDDASISPYLTDLYQHRQARKFLSALMKEEEEEIKKEAKKLLLRGLLEE